MSRRPAGAPGDRASAPREMQDESGVALVLALIFLLLFGLTVPALLGLSFASLGQAVASEDEGLLAYAVDGAVETSIATLRNDAAQGVEGGASCNATTTLNGQPVLVRCTPQAGSGATSVVPGGGASPLTVPGQAVLTLGTGETGVDKSSNSDVKVGGSVLSNSNVLVQSSSFLEIDGDVRAVSGCDSSRITATGTVDCAVGTPFADPGWSSEITSRPSLGVVPACTAGTVVVQPGTYVSATALEALTAGGCSGRTIHFGPGLYYFDFVGSDLQWDLTDPSTAVVGGTLVTSPTVTCDPAAAGIHWVFAGESRVRLADGLLDLCATPHTDRQQIAIHALGTNVGGTPSTTLSAVPGVITATGWTTVTDAGAIGGSYREVARTNSASATATQAFTMAALPAGAIVDNVTARVVHQETPTNRTIDPVVTVSGSASTWTVDESATMWTTSDVDLTSWYAADPTRLLSTSVSWTVIGSHNSQAGAGTFRLDDVTLRVTYHVDASLGGTSGCALQPLASGGCALVTTVGNPTRFVVHGTIYAPRASLDLQATNQSEQVSDRGIVARSLRLTITASAPAGYQMVSIPSGGSPVTVTADRSVLLEACPLDAATGDCRKLASGLDDIRLSTLVRFGDNSAGGRAQVDRWTVR